MMGRAPESIVVVRPMMDGVISDYSVTEQMLRYFLSKVRRHNIFKPQVMACVPSVITSVDQRTIVEVIHRTGAKRVCLIEEPVAAAIGAGIDVSKPHGCMVVDIGGGTTDIAVISMGASVIKKSIKVAGASFDEAIARFVRREYSVTIGRLTAEDIKIRVGCTFPQKTVDTMVAKGVNFVTGYPEEFEINSKTGVLVAAGAADCDHGRSAGRPGADASGADSRYNARWDSHDRRRKQAFRA